MAVRIRHASPGDEPAIVELVLELAAAEGYPSPIDEHYVRHYIASGVSDVLLACDDGTPVALLSYAVVPGLLHAADSGIIEALVVTARRRGEGIGRTLLSAALRLLEGAGCAEVSISVETDNERAQKLYFEAGLTVASVYLEKHVARQT
jgi:ribosomal protein S18 acetylase RimI-like enzyme